MDTENIAGHNENLNSVPDKRLEQQLHEKLNSLSHKVSEAEAAEAKVEEVNHPHHYNQYNAFEVIDVCEQLRAPDGTGNYNRGNAFKYLARAGWKNAEKHVEDLEKAKFYIQREIDRVTNSNWMEADPIQEMLGSSDHKHYCPECGIKLAPTIEDPSVMVCVNGHGWMRLPKGLTAGLWMPPLHPPIAKTPALRCPTCDFVLRESDFEAGEFYCDTCHDRVVVSRADGSIATEHDESNCPDCSTRS